MPTETNSQSVWDELWSAEGTDTWRTYDGPFTRIAWLLQHATRETQPLTREQDQHARIVDLGCGVGVLLTKVHDAIVEQQPEATYAGVDLSPAAIDIMVNERKFNVSGRVADFEERPQLPEGDILMCTEVLEHLTMPSVEHILAHSQGFKKCFFMVPNACLGPEVEPQHQRAWSAKEFRDLLRRYHPTARVEVFYNQEIARTKGHRGYLLGICGYEKPATMSFTMPVKNEGLDVERVLASFRGVADEIVIGIDDKTTDNTEEIVRRYADDVFFFTWEDNFSKARNACIDRCTCDWIFMSEGHEHLHIGHQWLLQLDEVPPFIEVLEVKREAFNNSWYFPWLFRRILDDEGKARIRFTRAVHNTVTGYDDKNAAKANQVSTWHERSDENAIERREQRKGMNKQELLKGLREDPRTNVRNMYYLGVEYKDVFCRTCKGHGKVHDPENSNGEPAFKPCADCVMYTPDNEPISMGVKPFAVRQHIYWLENFIRCARPLPLRYQARLSLGRTYQRLKMYGDAKRVLAQAIIDDATRIEHWVMLGEICEERGQTDLAMRFFEYAAQGIGRPPMSYTFLDKAMYTYLPAQKLVNTYAKLGLWDEALHWVQRLPSLMPPHAKQEHLDQLAEFEQQIQVQIASRDQPGQQQPQLEGAKAP